MSSQRLKKAFEAIWKYYDCAMPHNKAIWVDPYNEKEMERGNLRYFGMGLFVRKGQPFPRWKRKRIRWPWRL